MPEYEVLTGPHKFNVKSTKWWVNWWVKCISGVKMVGKENIVRENVLSEYLIKINIKHIF